MSNSTEPRLSEGTTMDTLQGRIAELEAELFRSRQIADELRQRASLLQQVLDNMPVSVFWKSRELIYLGGNRLFAQDCGMVTPENVIGKSDYDMSWSQEHAELYRSDDRQVMDSGEAKVRYEEPLRQASGQEIWICTNKLPLRNEAGEVVAVVGMYEDITARKQAELHELTRREEIIRVQAYNLEALSNPLIPISDGVVALILIGTIDQARAGQIMESLLSGIIAHSASIAIIDVTGVKIMDTSATSALVQAAKAARLLGAKVVLTGISSSVAQTLVQLGSHELGGVTTLGNLKAGIESALRR